MRTGSTTTRKKKSTRSPANTSSASGVSISLWPGPASAGPGRTLAPVLEPEQPPTGALAPRGPRLVLPREHPHPAQEAQTPGHLAAGVDPYRPFDELHPVDGQAHTHRVVEGENTQG